MCAPCGVEGENNMSLGELSIGGVGFLDWLWRGKLKPPGVRAAGLCVVISSLLDGCKVVGWEGYSWGW